MLTSEAMLSGRTALVQGGPATVETQVGDVDGRCPRAGVETGSLVQVVPQGVGLENGFGGGCDRGLDAACRLRVTPAPLALGTACNESDVKT